MKGKNMSHQNSVDIESFVSSLPFHICSCFRLAAPLMTEESVFEFDHLCHETASNSCLFWLQEDWIRQSTEYESAILPMDMHHHVKADSNYRWPYPLLQQEGHVYAVIQQWVEEPTDVNAVKTLAKKIQNHPQWQAVLDDVLQNLQRARQAP